jgi:tRNA(Arg) A34 adenosine deaminase TadA
MCAGAIYWAGIRHVVFGCSARRLGEIAGKGLALACREVLRASGEEVRVEGPFFEDEAARLHEQYWRGSGSSPVLTEN